MIDPYAYGLPASHADTVAFANATGYVWGVLDTYRLTGVPAPHIPDGFPYAWMHYVRTHASRMAIREAFAEWVATGTLPGLS